MQLMARPLRIQFENAYYHVTCRGNSGQEVFANNADREAFLDLLERSGDIYQADILAYVLMSTHFHLLWEKPVGSPIKRHLSREKNIPAVRKVSFSRSGLSESCEGPIR